MARLTFTNKPIKDQIVISEKKEMHKAILRKDKFVYAIIALNIVQFLIILYLKF